VAALSTVLRTENVKYNRYRAYNNRKYASSYLVSRMTIMTPVKVQISIFQPDKCCRKVYVVTMTLFMNIFRASRIVQTLCLYVKV
jgi:hypothetical protein